MGNFGAAKPVVIRYMTAYLSGIDKGSGGIQ
jgi:hypothetical protein